MIFRTLILTGATAAILAACNGATGGASSATTPIPQNDAEKLALATEIATSMTDPKTIDQMFDAVAKNSMPDMSAMCGSLPADKQPACLANAAQSQTRAQTMMGEYMVKVKAMMPELMKEMGGIMATQFSGPELAKMKDFYGSPEGQGIMKKMPAVMAEYQPKVMAKLQPLIMEMVQKELGGMAAPAAPN